MTLDLPTLHFNCSDQLLEQSHVDAAIRTLLADLEKADYEHLCPTPETQSFALAKRQTIAGKDPLTAKTLHDIWGWSLPVSLNTFVFHNLISRLVPRSYSTFVASNIIMRHLFSLTVRISSLVPFGSYPNYYVHSSWPTSSPDSVFFGPETYRFIRYLSEAARRVSECHLAIDVCSGAGAGAFQLAKSFPSATIFGLDINPKAVHIADVNRQHLFPDRSQSSPIQIAVSDGFLGVLEHVRGRVDVTSINPPFIAGDKRTYAAGGPTGMELILRIIGEAREALRVNGVLVGHMAAPIGFGGVDRFRRALDAMSDHWTIVAYDVLDVDIFGEEMASPDNYPDIARLSSVGIVLEKKA
ncbi:hypothetical protein DL93DRAFT_2198708 [Clavulina sp. PMI_390]|nr:hypothetical protein DL93DRAFT_2198708 [Clavulina sp. PMI_390]